MGITPKGVRKHAKNEYISFRYRTYANGRQHYLSIFLKCNEDRSGKPHRINLSRQNTVYALGFRTRTAVSGSKCLNLHNHLERVTRGKCTRFRVFVAGGASGSELCFLGHDLLKEENVHNCGECELVKCLLHACVYGCV